jgi:pyruvate,orthophosphate dikinase
MSQKYVYFFAQGQSEGDASMKNTLGGKGANLAEMTKLGIPVPPGFTISTDVCGEFYKLGEKLPEAVRTQVSESLKRVEETIGKKFGDATNPLLVSVRSGARASMPGMMDTILNLGLNDETVEGLAKSSNNERFAWDSYRRFIQMYSNVVMGMNTSLLEMTLEDLKDAKGYQKDTELTAQDLKGLVESFKMQITDTTAKTFPMDPVEQLWGAIEAVFSSWNNDRAITYRRLNSIPDDWGTAVNVQSMVFGNLGEESGTGVAFTRDPSTGEKIFFGEYLMNAQGEDVVAGIRTPQPITKAAADGTGLQSLEEECPEVFKELVKTYQKLENHYRDMQDIEFTIEKGQLWMLQTRTGKRTARAALRIATEMIDEKLIDESEALLRIDPASLDQLLHPTLDPSSDRTTVAKGLPASPGGVSGQVVFSSEEAVEWLEQGKKVILVRVETSPEDIEGMVASEGILTSRGGMTSHAAVVARGMGKCCVAGCGDVQVNESAKEFRANGYVIKEGDVITLDGSTGEVFLGEVKTIPPLLDGPFERVMQMADRVRKLRVRTNADTPTDAQTAIRFGAEGIGLCRTEHMFFAPERIDWVRRMILAENKEGGSVLLLNFFPCNERTFTESLKPWVKGQ